MKIKKLNKFFLQIVQKNNENIVVILLIVIFSFIFLLQSPLHPWIHSSTSTDSSVFKTVALMMERGYMPYKDSFDHKGPFLYILNWIGNRISPYRGIWVIEFFFITTTFFLIYKISRLKCCMGSSILITMVSFSLLFRYYAGGNLTEEYAMVFIAIAVYIFLDYLMNQKTTRIRLLICGFSLGATLLLRPNMISVWIIFSIFIFVQLIIGKKWNTLMHLALWFTAGACIAIIPIFIWLLVNHALAAFWQSYIVFNKIYISDAGGRATFTAKWHSYITFCNTPVFIISFATAAYLCKIKDKVINITYIVYMLITLLLICLSGMQYNHYGMVIVPIVAYPLASFLGEIENIDFPKVTRLIFIILHIYFLSDIITPDWLPLISTVPEAYENRAEEHKGGEFFAINNIICEKTDADDAISVYGNWDLIYVLCDRKHATRYSYQFPIGEVMPEIMEEYMKELQEEQPKIIVIQAYHYDDNIDNFLSKNHYQLVWSLNGDLLNPDNDIPRVYEKN